MTCQELVSFLDDHRSGELARDTRARFEAHLRECPACVAYLRSYNDALEVARRAVRRDEDVAAGMPDELVSAIVAASRGTRRRSPKD